jgi:hypothetical protein
MNAPAYNPAAGGPTGITDEDAQQGDRFSPCPFCGATAEIITLDGEADAGAMTVQCTNDACGAASGLIYPLMDDVIDLLRERWNKRAAQPTSAKPLPLTDEQIDNCLPFGMAEYSVLVGPREIRNFARAVVESAHNIKEQP